MDYCSMDNLIIGLNWDPILLSSRFKDALTLKNICLLTRGRYMRENPGHIQIRKHDVV